MYIRRNICLVSFGSSDVNPFLTQLWDFGSVSDLLVFISGLVRYNEVKSLKVSPRILGVIKIAFL